MKIRERSDEEGGQKAFRKRDGRSVEHKVIQSTVSEV